MSKHRITRQEIKHDEFVSTVGRITRWAEDNYQVILWSVAGVVAAFLAGFGLYSWLESRRMNAEAALDQVTRAFHATIGEEAAGGESFASAAERNRAVVERAEEVIASYGSTPAGARARYYRALALYDDGRLEEAAGALADFLDRSPDHFLAPLARRKQAQILEREGDLQGACDGYRALLDLEVPEFPNEIAYMDLGRCLSSMGDSSQAADLYRQMLDEYPDSLYAPDVRQRLVEIEGSPG